MIDSFPYESWLNPDGSLNQDISAFWTFGPGADHNLTGTFVLTGLGMLVMIAALVYWVWLERKKLNAQAEFLRAAGGAPPPAGPGSSQPPSAGPPAEYGS